MRYKLKIFSFLTLATITLLTGCIKDETWNGREDETRRYGKISLADLNIRIAGLSASTEGRTEEEVELTDFVIEIHDSETHEAVEDPMSYGEVLKHESLSLPVGNYIVSVSGGNNEKAAFESPFYEGESDVFKIEPNKETVVDTIECMVGNVAVVVRIDDRLHGQIDDIANTRVTVYNHEEYPLVYSHKHIYHKTNQHGQTGYFEHSANTMVAIFESVINGTEVTMRKNLTSLEKGQYRVITYSPKETGTEPSPGNGNVSPGISVDVTIEDGDIDIIKVKPEDPGTAGDPEDPDWDIKRPGWDDNTGGSENDPGQDNPDNPGDQDNPNEPAVPDQPETPVNTVQIGYSKDIDPAKENPVLDNGDYTVTISSENVIEKLLITITSTNSDFEDTVKDGGLDEFDLLHPTSQQEEMFAALDFPCGKSMQGKTKIDVALSALIPMLGVFDGLHTFNLVVTDALGFQKKITIKFRVS